MPSEMSPKQFQEYAQNGVKRLKNFRSARLMFLRNYTGQYYDRDHGRVGTEALNLTFNAIRTLVPQIVMSNPKHNVSSRYLANAEYADLLGLALTEHDKDIRIKDVYRRVVVDAIFTLGILKTGLAESDSVYAFDEYDQVDAGEIYTEAVDFDNFVCDPRSNDHLFRDAAFLGDRICIPRRQLLDSGLYQNGLVERLPSVDSKRDQASNLSQRSLNTGEIYDLQDEVEIIELWVPSYNAIVTIPGCDSVKFDEFLRVDDYYGPDTGPYTLLALTPPVPGNPLPVPAVGVWHDLHVLANRMAKKIIDQAERQKDIVGYRRAAADDAQEALDAGDGEAVAMDDPDALRVHSFGGQQNSNEAHLYQLQGWFNMMAANPQAVGGQNMDAESATEAQILAQNANIGLEDMKDLVYDMSAIEAAKRAWYLHTDPFIEMPLTRRVTTPPQYGQGPNGPMIVEPGRVEDEQIYLTPEARRGDFLDFHFEVEPESMARKDARTRFQEAMDFAVKILPAVMQSAQTAAMLGLPFSPKQFLLRMAKDRGIDWLDEVFYDPEFQQQMMVQMMQAPQAEGSKGQAGPAQAPQMPNAMAGGGRGQRSQQQAGNDPLAALLQNGQPGQVAANPNIAARQRADAQRGANDAQSRLKGGY